VNLVEEYDKDDDEDREDTNSDNEEKSNDEKEYERGNARRHGLGLPLYPPLVFQLTEVKPQNI
jgi:hypothetical protein